MKINVLEKVLHFLVPVSLVLMLSGCGGSSSGTAAGSSGSTLTLTGFSAVSTIPGLTYNSTISNSGTITSNPTLQVYSRTWSTPNNAGLASLIYQVTSNEELLNFDVTADASAPSSAMVWYYAALSPLTNTGFCHVSGTNVNSLPICSALNITVSRSAGTITFASTPAVSYVSGSSASSTGTMSGTLSFTPF